MAGRIVCVTGTDRGIGLALVKQLLAAGDTVFAGGIMRDNAELARLTDAYPGRLHAFVLDVGSDASVREAAAFVRERTDRLDWLVNNAAILGDTVRTIEDELDFDEVQRVLNVTAVGAIRVTNALIGEVMNGGKLVVNISSEAGSIGQSYREAWFGYCMAKAALNMGATLIHNKIRDRGGRVMQLHTGWVKTYLSGEWNDEGTFTPDESATMILRMIEKRGGELHKQPLYVEVDTEKELPW